MFPMGVSCPYANRKIGGIPKRGLCRGRDLTKIRNENKCADVSDMDPSLSSMLTRTCRNGASFFLVINTQTCHILQVQKKEADSLSLRR